MRGRLGLIISKTLFMTSFFLASACQSIHSLPPENYSKEVNQNPNVFSLVFDERGDLYPQSPNSLGIAMPTSANNKSFQIRNALKGYDRESTFDATINQVNQLIERQQPRALVIQIVGFNVDFKDAKDNFQTMRDALIENGVSIDEYVFLEVYWDSKKQENFPTIWFKSALNSNFAGQYGLRRIVDSLPNKSDIIMFTHSRGAAVALSTFANPLYNCDDCQGEYKAMVNEVTPTIDRSKLGNISAFMLAPAVGDGHVYSGNEFNDDQKKTGSAKDVAKYFDAISLSFNKYDFATKKGLGGVKLKQNFNDTRLNSDAKYAIKTKNFFEAQEVRVFQAEYDTGRGFSTKTHALESYLNSPKNKAAVRCSLKAVGFNVVQVLEDCDSLKVK